LRREPLVGATKAVGKPARSLRIGRARQIDEFAIHPGRTQSDFNFIRSWSERAGCNFRDKHLSATLAQARKSAMRAPVAFIPLVPWGKDQKRYITCTRTHAEERVVLVGGWERAHPLAAAAAGCNLHIGAAAAVMEFYYFLFLLLARMVYDQAASGVWRT